MPAAFPSPTWLVGCGNMAGAMVEGWRAAGLDFSNVTVIRPSGRPVEGIRTLTEVEEGEVPRLVLLGFKPQKLDEAAPAIARLVGWRTIVVSMLAGVSAASIEARFPGARAVVRIMPSLPVAQRAGVAALYSESGDEDARACVESLMSLLGSAPWCDDEDDFAVIGALAGAGPAFVARFASALANAGEGLGLDGALAERLAIQTLAGTGAMMAATGETPDELARRVASPKGTTEQGLAVLDAPDGLPPLIARTLEAAVRRSRELAAAARRD